MQDMIYLFLAPGFEEVEAMTPLDILRRAGLAVASGVRKKGTSQEHRRARSICVLLLK